MDKSTTFITGIMLASSLALSISLHPAQAAGCQVLSKSTLENKANPYGKTIRSASNKYGVHEDLVKAVITVESCFRSSARGTSGEKGLMQLMPATARRFSVKSGYNPWQNIHGGTRYLGYLLKRYDGDAHRAVAAYNAGEGNVRPGGRIRNHEYVSKVMRAYGKFSGGGKQAAVPSGKKYRIKKASLKKRTTITRTSRVLPWGDKSRQPQASAKAFRVKAGHTVYEVMRQTGVPVKRIISLNGLQMPYHLQAGQSLRLR